MTMQSGTYYVGDLCYVMHAEWKEVCDLIIRENTCLDGEFNLKDGRRFAIYSTAYGDGEYSTNNHKTLGVDSGSIGCIKVEDIDKDNQDNFTNYGMIVDFDEDFETSGSNGDYRNWNGDITFGHIEVYTDENPDEEEDEEYYCQSY